MVRGVGGNFPPVPLRMESIPGVKTALGQETPPPKPPRNDRPNSAELVSDVGGREEGREGWKEGKEGNNRVTKTTGGKEGEEKEGSNRVTNYETKTMGGRGGRGREAIGTQILRLRLWVATNL